MLMQGGANTAASKQSLITGAWCRLWPFSTLDTLATFRKKTVAARKLSDTMRYQATDFLVRMHLH